MSYIETYRDTLTYALAIVGAFAMTTATYGQTRPNSESLLRECSAAVRYMDGDKSRRLFDDLNNCIAYLQGFRDGLDTTNATGTVVCVPAEATPGLLARVVVKHLQDNPGQLQRDRMYGIFAALVVRYPCPKR